MYQEGHFGHCFTALALPFYPNTDYMPHSSRIHPGLLVLSRLLAAIFGGYALASALAVFLAAALPGARADAVMAGMQWSFVLHVLAVVWAFSPVAVARVWLGLLLPTAALGAASLLLARGASGG